MRRCGMIRWCAAASLMMSVGCGEGDTERHDAVVNLSAWPMHAIESRLRGPNALGPGDVNGDGYMDYVTNYEFDQRYVVHLHPGDPDAARRPWPRVVAFLHHPPGGSQRHRGSSRPAAC